VFSDEGERLTGKCRVLTAYGATYEIDRSVTHCATALGLNIIEL